MDNAATSRQVILAASEQSFPISAIFVLASTAYVGAILLLLVVKRQCQARGKTCACPMCPEFPGCCECETCALEAGTCSQAGHSIGEGCGCEDPPKTCAVCAKRYCISFESCRCSEFHSCGCLYTAQGRFRLPCPTCPTNYCPSCPTCPESEGPTCACCQPTDEPFQCPSFTCPTCPACPENTTCVCECQTPECDSINCFCFSVNLTRTDRQPHPAPPVRGGGARGEVATRR